MRLIFIFAAGAIRFSIDQYAKTAREALKKSIFGLPPACAGLGPVAESKIIEGLDAGLRRCDGLNRGSPVFFHRKNQITIK